MWSPPQADEAVDTAEEIARTGLDLLDGLLDAKRIADQVAGIGDLVGTLETGKWASFIGWNADQFDITSYPVAVYGEGRRLFSE